MVTRYEPSFILGTGAVSVCYHFIDVATQKAFPQATPSIERFQIMTPSHGHSPRICVRIPNTKDLQCFGVFFAVRLKRCVMKQPGVGEMLYDVILKINETAT